MDPTTYKTARGHGPLCGLFKLHDLYACDLVACSCCLPDLRHEDIWLCLGARSCHLSIHCLPPFRHISLSISLVYPALLRRQELSFVHSSPTAFSSCLHFVIHTPAIQSRIHPARLTFDMRTWASFYLSIHHPPPFSPSSPATIHLPTFQ